MIEHSTDEDIRQILEWLGREAAEEGNTFHSNCDTIAKGHGEGELYVLRDLSGAAAFALGSPGMIDILETRPGCRRLGYGRQLAQLCIDRAAAADVAAIEIQCADETSLPFWQALGFEQMRPRHGHNPWVFLRIAKRHALPGGTPVKVVVRTFDEEVMYSDGGGPIHEFRPSAIRSAAGIILLGERIVLHEPNLKSGRDLVVDIEVSGRQIARDKVKRAKLAAIGVRCDRFQQYYLDQFNPAGDVEKAAAN